MKFLNLDINGIRPAIKSIRNAMQSWEKSDSKFNVTEKNIDIDNINAVTYEVIGEKDLKLASALVRTGNSDGKFARGIQVAIVLQAPAYFIAELATYKIGTIMNSSSLQHTGSRRDFTIDDFDIDKSYDNLTWSIILNSINELRRKYTETKNYKYFRLMRQLIPQSYLYTITWTANYQVLRTIYKDRRKHRLIEWQKFCDFIETLPYAKELILGEK